MRLRGIFLFLLFFILLFGCSRESSIKENLNLRNNHSIVFAFRHSFDNPEAFADSIRTLDSVLVFDTITVTVHDTIHFMGFLRHNAEKVYRYAWRMHDNDSAKGGANAKPFAYAYDSVGIYSPLFIAVDGNGARDTAGRGQFIRVIDTPPNLLLPADTLWTRASKDASFAIEANDSLGEVTRISINWSGGKKADTSYAAVFTKETKDSLFLEIPFDAANLNKDFNQKIIITISDEDGNLTTDSLFLHFNQLPVIELLQPADNGRYAKDQRFAFYYRASDEDNPDQLRYYIRAGKSPTGDGTPPVLTDANLIAGPLKEKSFEGIDESGTWFMDSKLLGRLYWQVYVTDGFDTTTSETWTFFLGNLSETTGTFRGTILLEGKTNHSGIKIEFLDSLDNRAYTTTNNKGVYTIDLPSGLYHMTARDTIGYGFTPGLIKNKFIEAGDIVDLGSITLKDPSAPVISAEDLADTLRYRDFVFTGQFADYGSQVKSAKAWLDGSPVTVSTVKVNSWAMNFSDLADGLHSFNMIAIDSAGLISDTLKVSFFIEASSMDLLVNGKNSVMVGQTTPLVFVATLDNMNPPADSVIWTWVINGVSYSAKTNVEANEATFTLTASEIPTAINGILYEMQATTNKGNAKAKVRFGFIGNNPIVYFSSPKTETVVTINDVVNFVVEAQAGALATSYTLLWECPTSLATGSSCPTDPTATETSLAWSNPGLKKVVIQVEDDQGGITTDTMAVNVIPDPPTVKIKSAKDTLTQKINASIELEVTASDKYGTISSLQWGCSNGNVAFDNTKDFTGTPLESISEKITFLLPGTESNAYRCVVKAFDDDGEFGLDTVYFRVILDKPTVTVHTKQSTQKINTEVSFKASAYDSLGTIDHYYVACDSNLKNLSWEEISAPDTLVTMPSKACTWYCVMKVTDNDNLSAEDTTRYTVILDPPTVITSEDTLTTTIKDVIVLDAMAADGMGYIALYEWSCGPAGTAGNNFAWSSTTTPRYSATMPSIARNNYLCIIRVTDDDGLTAQDTTRITVLLDPPKVTVTNKNVILREGLNISLNASAKDSMGYIAQREWSCGVPSQINGNWKEVSQYDTIWKAPSTPQVNYICVARATDDDGNQATDTTFITFSTETPIVTVEKEKIYVKAGDYIDLSASINDVWNDIEWFRWVCGTPGSAALKDTSVKWIFEGSFEHSMNPTYTTPGQDLLCIVFVSETGTGYVAKDTSQVLILKKPPVGVISGQDTAFIWSGDESLTPNGKYFYNSAINGSSSILGTIGDANSQDFWWQFSHYDPTYWYQGKKTGAIDTNIAEFNEAFIRRQSNGSITIRLDYRDSTTTETDPYYKSQFLYRHRAEQVSKTIYFRKAWNNESYGSDSVLAVTTYPVAPHLVVHNDKPTIAFVNQSGHIEVRKFNGTSSWNMVGSSITPNGAPASVELAVNSDNDLFIAYLDSAGHRGHVLKSNGGTSPWAELSTGTGASHVAKLKLKIRPSTKAPVLAWIGNTNAEATNKAKTYYQAWNTSNMSFDSPISVFSSNSREFDIAFDASSNWLAVSVGTTTNYVLDNRYYTSNNTYKTTPKIDPTKAESIQLNFANNTFYLGLRNRDNGDQSGFPQLYVGANSAGSSVSWSKSGGISKGFGRMSYNVNFTLNASGNPLAVFDESIRANSSQVHAYRFDGSSWNVLGENELPYFKNNFVTNKGYYLRGHQPSIVTTNNGDIYIAMRALEQPGSAGTVLRNRNNGPLVMKYLGDYWENP